ncbi:MAG: 16S rRNA (cytosine(1402)-N(4))-methyltransferase RsmH [Planctomycetota bacterium]
MGSANTDAASGGGAGGHVPVLVEEVLRLLDPRPGETLLDATVGSAGHSLAVAKIVGPEGAIVGIDRDETAVARARAALSGAGPRVCLRQADFAEAERVLDECGTDEVDMVILDLGVSSEQLDDPSRGYAFRATGPLDMRADRRQELTAEALVNDSDEADLADIIFKFGEEREARRIAREIVRARAKERIRTTTELAELIARAKRERRGRIHPATRVFQALRIAVNRELESLEAGLVAAWRRLAPGGRMAAISFHSLEDRIVKGFFRERKKADSAQILTKKPVRAGKRERDRNPRSRSAKLRVLRRPSRGPDGGAA